MILRNIKKLLIVNCYLLIAPAVAIDCGTNGCVVCATDTYVKGRCDGDCRSDMGHILCTYSCPIYTGYIGQDWFGVDDGIVSAEISCKNFCTKIPLASYSSASLGTNGKATLTFPDGSIHSNVQAYTDQSCVGNTTSGNVYAAGTDCRTLKSFELCRGFAPNGNDTSGSYKYTCDN